MLKILHAIHSLNPAHGGTTYGLRGLVNELLRLGHETEIIVLDDPASPWLLDWPCKVHALGTGRGNYGFNWAFWTGAQRLIQGFDRAIIHGLWQFHGIALWRACRRFRVPYAVYPHGMLDGWFATAYPAKHRLKAIYWFCVERRVLWDARAVFFTTQAELAAGKDTFPLFRVAPAFAAFGIVGPPEAPATYREQFDRRVVRLAGRRIILFLGRLHTKKGCELLLQGFAAWMGTLSAAERGNWHLRFVGPTDDREYLTQLQRFATTEKLIEAGLVSFEPAVSGDEKWQELSRAEVLALPSHQENFGVVIAEAFACATPALISNKVNGWQLMAETQAALVAGDDVDGVVALLTQWSALTPQDVQIRKLAAVAFFHKIMSAEVSARAVLLGLN